MSTMTTANPFQRERESGLDEPLHFISTSATDRQSVEFLNEVFSVATDKHISDMHFESTDRGMIVRYRFNGEMQLYREVDQLTARDIDNKIRVKAKLPVVDRMMPFDGKIRFQSKHSGSIVDVRISLLPTIHGVSAVCRLLDPNKNLMRLDDIDMPGDVRKGIRRMVEQPQGMFLVCGPTGSGKTTTLYGILQEFQAMDKKIITVEDPVEYRIPGFVQCETNIKLGFSGALRSILRQDPDIILVGEIRDSDTARIATQAALTGHLVLSTIHANSALLTIPRLFDLGVDSHALSAALSAVSAQRLVPTLCPHCKRARYPDEWEREELARTGYLGVDALYDASPEGCQHCVKGYKGRVPVFEFFSVGGKERLAIEHQDKKAIEEGVIGQPCYESLQQSVFRLVATGKTSMAAAIATIGSSMYAEE